MQSQVATRNSILYFNVYFMLLSLNAHKMIVKRKRETFMEAEKHETRKKEEHVIHIPNPHCLECCIINVSLTILPPQ